MTSLVGIGSGVGVLSDCLHLSGVLLSLIWVGDDVMIQIFVLVELEVLILFKTVAYLQDTPLAYLPVISTFISIK